MRKYLFFLAFVAYLIAPKAQTTVWSDNFDDEDISNWTLIDSDGDGFLWDVAQLVDGDTGEPIGTPILTSVSWSGFPLTPDNWAISPAIDLTGVSGTVTLKWSVFASDPAWNQENYGVYVSTTNTAAGMIAAGELFTEFDLPAELEERTLDMSSFAGQTVYVGFRHYDVTDQFRIGIDDVSVEAAGGGPAEGCLEADNGQYPTSVYIPSCNGAAETITSAGWTGEYSMVTVTSGEEYIFSVSDPSYFITIGNEAGDAVIASGTGSVTWTANVSGNVRFYTHFTSACDFDSETFLTRLVQCGEPPVEPDYGCDQSYDGEYYLANSVSSDFGYTVANDFFVPGDVDAYVMNSITAALLPIAGSDADFSTFDVTIHSDNAGTPGDVLETWTGLTATSVTLRDELFAGYNNYDVTLTLPGYEIPVTAGTDTRYWVSISATSASAQNIFWIGYPHTTGWVTATNYQSEDGGTTWNQIIDENTPGMFFDSIWSIDSTCEEIIVEGCLDAPYGQYPTGEAFVPECQGEPETITEAAWTGEYSLVTVTAGTEYIFSSSVETDFVTISNADGTVVLAAGATPLTWTADAGEDVRFYLHLDAECNSINEGLRSRIVQCGEFTPPTGYCMPELDCTDGDVITNVTFAGINNDSDCSPNGYGDYTEMEAEVEAGETYSMSVTVGAGWDYEATMVWIDFNNDFIFDPATEYFFIGSDPGTTNTADITIPAGTPDGEYRLRVRVGAVNPDLNDLSLLACDEDTVFGETEDYTLVVGELGVSDMDAFDFSYYPNPVKDELNISAKKVVQSVSVYNLAGQQISAQKFNATNGKVSTSSLAPGVYVFKAVLEGGQVETFKVVKK